MPRPINFLHLSTFYPPWSFGGDAMHIYRLAHALGDDGHQVDVVHCLDAYHLLHPGPPAGGFPPHPNVRVHGLRSGWGWLSPLLTQQTGAPWLKRRRLRGILAGRPFDVLHFHNVSLLGPDVLALDPPGRRPVKLYTAHEYWLVCPTHVLWKLNRRVCDSPQCVRCTLAARRPPQLWRATRRLERAAGHVHRFLAPSRASARIHAERGFAPPIECLPYFVDEPDGLPSSGPRPQPAPYFLFVGRLEEIKGVQTLIGAWPRAGDVDLLVAGSGEYERPLKAAARDNSRIRFLGHQPQSALGPLYAHAEACIVPSLTWETFGIIVIEAFMRRTPVIARDIGALSEIVRQSDGGLLYRTEDELIDAVHRIRASPSLRETLGARGYDAWRRLWSRDVHLEQYYELLARTAREVLGEVPWER